MKVSSVLLFSPQTFTCVDSKYESNGKFSAGSSPNISLASLRICLIGDYEPWTSHLAIRICLLKTLLLSKLQASKLMVHLLSGMTTTCWKRDGVKQPTYAADLYSFASKINGKRKNTLGPLVSMDGFSNAWLQTTSSALRCLILMDGMDLNAILTDRIKLDDLLYRKRRARFADR